MVRERTREGLEVVERLLDLLAVGAAAELGVRDLLVVGLVQLLQDLLGGLLDLLRLLGGQVKVGDVGLGRQTREHKVAALEDAGAGEDHQLDLLQVQGARAVAVKDAEAVLDLLRALVAANQGRVDGVLLRGLQSKGRRMVLNQICEGLRGFVLVIP